MSKICVSEIAEGILSVFSLWLKKKNEKYLKNSATLKLEFKEENCIFSEVNYLNCTKMSQMTQFCIIIIAFSLYKEQQEHSVDPFGSP